MDAVGRVIGFLKETKGVIDVKEMDDDLSRTIWNIEKNTITSVKTEYENVAYDVAMKKAHRLCMFYSDEFVFENTTVVKLMSSDGTVMGTTLTPEEIPAYKERDDVIWISEDFVVFPNIVGKGNESFVLYPIEMTQISSAVPECRGPIAASPTTSSDARLKRAFGRPQEKGVYTAVIAFD